MCFSWIVCDCDQIAGSHLGFASKSAKILQRRKFTGAVSVLRFELHAHHHDSFTVKAIWKQ